MHRLNVCIVQEGRKHLCGDGLILNRVGGYLSGGGLAIIYRYHSYLLFIVRGIVVLYDRFREDIVVTICAHRDYRYRVVADTGTLNLWLAVPAH